MPVTDLFWGYYETEFVAFHAVRGTVVGSSKRLIPAGRRIRGVYHETPKFLCDNGHEPSRESWALLSQSRAGHLQNSRQQHLYGLWIFRGIYVAFCVTSELRGPSVSAWLVA